MKTLNAISISTASLLILSGCSPAYIFSTDSGCGVITPENQYPDLKFSGDPEELAPLDWQVDLSWEVEDAPLGEGESVYSGAVTTLPASSLLTDLYSIDLQPASFSAASQVGVGYRILADEYAEVAVATASAEAPHRFSISNYSLISEGYQNELFDDDGAIEELGNLPTPLYHLPITLIASCGEDFTLAMNQRLDSLNPLNQVDLVASNQDDEESDEGPWDDEDFGTLELTSASSVEVYPGFDPELISFEASLTELRITGELEGWQPLVMSVGPWFDFLQRSPIPVEIDFSSYPDIEKDWISLGLLTDGGLASSGLSEEQPLVWNFNQDGEGSFGASYDEEANQVVIEIETPFTASNFANRLNNLANNIQGEEDFEPIVYPNEIEYLVIYAAFFREFDNGEYGFKYTFERLAPRQRVGVTGDSVFDVLVPEVPDVYQRVSKAIIPGAGVENLKINELTESQFLQLSNFDQQRWGALGEFANAGVVTGLDSGLLVTAGYDAGIMGLSLSALMQNLEPDQFQPPYYLGLGPFEGVSFSGDELDPYPESPLGALAQAIDADPNIPAGLDSADGSKVLFDPTTISFELAPTNQYLKLDFVLAMTETGQFDDDTGEWSNYIVEYPDGLGIFVKSKSASWLEATNCAAIPTTNSYLSMFNAGILPPGDPAELRAEAAANYAALVAKTLQPGYLPNPNLFVDRSLTSDDPPNDDRIPPPMLAYNTAETGSLINFVTTTMTCVVDVAEIASEGEAVSIGLAVANLYDTVFPPALFLSSSSLRFSDNQVAVEREVEAELFQTPSPAAGYNGPVISSAPVTVAPGQSVTLQGSNLDSVTELKLGAKSILPQTKASSLQFVIPRETELGTYDLVVISSFGELRVAGLIIVDGRISIDSSVTSSVKRIGDQARVMVQEVIGAGKVQILFNGREIAWVRALDGSDPKLRFANGNHYLVRTVKLVQGRKNVLEIFVDGERLRRVAYSR